MSEKLQRLAKIFIPVAVSVLLLVVLVKHLDTDNTTEMLLSIRYPQFLLSAIIAVLYFSTSGIRFAWLTRPFFKLPYAESILLNYIVVLSAHAFGILSDGVRVLYTKAVMGTGMKQAIELNLTDRLLSAWLLGVYFTASIPFLWQTSAGYVLFALSGLGCFLIYQIAKSGNAIYILKPFIAGIQNRFDFFRQISLAGIGVVLCGLILFVLAKGMHFPLTISQCLLISPLTLLVSSLPFTYAGLGARETAFAIIIPMVSTTTSNQAFALSIMLGACFVVSSIIGGVPSAILCGINLRRALSSKLQKQEIK